MKHLDCLPPTVLQFRLRLHQFDYTIHHVPAKELYTTDALSTSISGVSSVTPEWSREFCRWYLISSSSKQHPFGRVLSCLESRYYLFIALTLLWKGMATQVNLCVALNLIGRLELTSELTVCSDLLLCNWCAIMPEYLQEQTLKKIYHRHQGIQKCKSRVSTVMWWYI